MIPRPLRYPVGHRPWSFSRFVSGEPSHSSEQSPNQEERIIQDTAGRFLWCFSAHPCLFSMLPQSFQWLYSRMWDLNGSPPSWKSFVSFIFKSPLAPIALPLSRSLGAQTSLSRWTKRTPDHLPSFCSKPWLSPESSSWRQLIYPMRRLAGPSRVSFSKERKGTFISGWILLCPILPGFRLIILAFNTNLILCIIPGKSWCGDYTKVLLPPKRFRNTCAP